MGTTWEEIEARAMTYIKDDLSLEQDLKTRLPVFYNRMKAYMTEAIPLFNRPPEMLERLATFTEPVFDSYSYTAESAQESGFVIETGISGAELCAVGILAEDQYGDVSYTPLTAFSYDAETGNVTVNEAAAEGTVFDLDFYTGGSFETTLNETEKGILAFAVYNRYEHRFDNNVLERTAKIRDSAFTTISEASQTQANTQRMKAADSQLFDMLRAYQQNVDYLKARNRSSRWPI